MRNTRQNLPTFIRHPVMWRQRILPGVINRTWWVSRQVAALYRRAVLHNTRFVAVVGSVGKSTTTRAVAATLGHELPLSFHRGFGNSYTSVALRILGCPPTTPCSVIEAGINEPGQMAEIAEMLRPDLTVVTSIASDHGLRLPTFEIKRSEKAHMVRVLSETGTAILNGDDPNVRWMAGQTAARVVTFGFEPQNDVRATCLSLDWPRGMQFKLSAQGMSREVSIRLVGRQMVYPALAATAVALEFGLELDQVLPALEHMRPTPERLQPLLLEDGTILLRDDCKADFETMEAALDLLTEIPASRRGVLLGDMPAPPGDPVKVYQHLGQRVAEISSYALFYGDSPAIQGFLQGSRLGGLQPQQSLHVRGGIQALGEAVRRQLQPGDVLLIKGYGSQRLGRIALALQGKSVRCDIPECAWPILCEYCPMLERGWDSRW